jgi:hypothetical protein
MGAGGGEGEACENYAFPYCNAHFLHSDINFLEIHAKLGDPWEECTILKICPQNTFKVKAHQKRSGLLFPIRWKIGLKV